MWNLLSNAIKFTPRGGCVQVRVRGTPRDVEISVGDTGQGIGPEFLPHVFERLRQGDGSTTRTHGGLGLGLAIVRHLVELHGGAVAAESPGISQGATFTVRLPLACPPRELPSEPVFNDPEFSDHHSIARSPVRSLDGLHVLVVDDEPDAREVFRLGLGTCGAKVTTASSAAEAYEKLQALRPDVLVSDIGMPGEDGFSLMRRVRQLAEAAGGRVPAVALTAYAGAEDRDRALLAGFQMHVPKPVEPLELAAALAAFVRRDNDASSAPRWR
jgi:CheY-like chemotaxis protein